MENRIKRIGVLTSGGDAPGMNAAVRAVVRTAVGQGVECIGIRRGWSGLISSDFVRLDSNSVSHIINRGGTILYTARSKEFMDAAGREKAIATCKLLGLDAIVAIGGDGTFRGALALSRQVAEHGQKLDVIGIPATIDNDIGCSYYTIGFPSWRLQYRHRVHRQAPGHHAVPRALLGGGGHGPARGVSGALCGHSCRRHRGAHPGAPGGL